MNNNFMYDPSNYDANGDLKNPMLQQMAQQAMQAQAQQNANSGVGVLSQYQPQDGYLSGGQFAEQAKINGREAQLDNRELRNGEKLDRLNPFSESGYMNEEDYAKRYAPDGTLRDTGERPQGVLDGAMQSTQGVLNNMPNLTGMPAYLSGGSGVNGQPNAAAQQPVQPNTHEMPDGTVMEGATHEDYLQSNSAPANPVLESQDDLVINKGKGIADTVRNGVLSSIGQSVEKNDPRGTGTNNRRDETETAEELKAKREAKERRNEMLIRVGGAIAGGAQRGGLAAMQAGGQEYGALKDYNREMEQQQFDNDQARDQERNRISTAQQTDLLKKEDAMVQRNARIDSLDNLIDDLTAAGDNVTGVWDGTVSNLFDRATGAPEANLRLRLEEQRVDAALTKVEKTKGAISNREMDLFLSPMPKLRDSEEVWIDWMTMQRNIAAKMSNIASGGMGSDGRYVNAVSEDAELDSLLANYAKKYPPN